MYAKPDWEDAMENEVKEVLQKGEIGRVISIRHSKDFKFYEIRLDDGRFGYVRHGDQFRIQR
jgi:hypothetical protein